MPPSSGIRLQLVTTTEEFHRLEPYWNPLLQRSGSNSVFLSFEYLTTWWETYGSNFKLRILAAWKDNDLAGLAPLAIGHGHGPRSWLRHLAFLGFHGNELSEHLDFIVAPELSEEVIPQFVRFVRQEMRHEWDLLYLSLVPSESSHLASLLPEASAHGIRGGILDTVASPYLCLPGSWETLLESKSKNFRKQFNNLRNRLHKQHRVEILQAGEDLGIDDAFDVLLRLNQQRWGAEGKAFTTQKTRAFHRALAHRFHSLGQLSFFLMKIDGAFAAVRFDYVYDGKLWNIQGGWDPQFAPLSPGRLLLAWEIQWCIREGLREYDFLAGEAEYKRSWATHERRLSNVEFFRPGSMKAGIFLGLRHLKDSFKPAKADPATSLSQAPVSST